MKNRIQCITKRCEGVVSNAATDGSRDGHWQFQCPKCSYWNLVSREGSVQGTSQTPFDLERLPWAVRSSLDVKRSPPGGV